MKKIALHNKYSQYLSTSQNISDVEVLETGDIKCNIHIDTNTYSILLMGLVDNKMPLVFLCNPKEGQIKPHQLHFKKSELIHLCLSVRDDISVKNQNYMEVIDYTLRRVVRLLSLNEEEEQREFRKEFLFFWNQVSVNEEKANIYLHSSRLTTKLKVYKKKKTLTFIDNNISLNSAFKDKLQPELIDAIYIPLINSNKVMPPFEDKTWEKEYLIEICNYCISEENVELIESIKISGNSAFLIFSMDVPDILPITFLLKVNFDNKKVDNLYERIKGEVGMEYYSSQRCDSDYLFKRIGTKNIIKDKNVLIIGAGSLGSYIINELPKIGIKRLTIFDDDELSVENTMRHELGSFYIGSNKAIGMKFQLEMNYPEIIIDYKKEKFLETKLSEYALDTYDLLIITTGGTDFMLRLNKQFKKINVGATVIFSWIESNGIGVHALPINYSQIGCFQCLYSGVETNKAHYSNQKSDLKVIGTGCGGVFNPYGNLSLLRGSAMILELIQLFLNGQLNTEKNLLYSIRTLTPIQGNDYILSKRDFEISKDFYIDARCEVCGS